MTRRAQILMLPSWYPTKESPIPGSFFKEQAVCLSQSFDFAVVVLRRDQIRFRLSMLLGRPAREPTFELVEELPGYKEIVARLTTFSFGRKLSRLLALLRIDPNKDERKQFDEFVHSTIEHLNRDFDVAPDVVYAMTAQINGDVAMSFSRRLGVPLILAEHNPFPLPGTLISPAIKAAIEGCDALLVVSQDKARQVLMQNLACQPEVIGNLVDGTVFFRSAERHEDSKNLLVVAAYNFYKDFETLFKAINALTEMTAVRFQVTVVGFSPFSHTDDFSYGARRFYELLDNYGLRSSMRLVPMAKRSEMPGFYSEADAFVMTSIQEGLPVSALEAASCGLPIFSTRCGGVEDFVDDSVGRLFPIRDHLSLAEGLRDFVEGKIVFDPQLIREHVLKRYGSEAFLGRFRDTVGRVLGDHQAQEQRKEP